MKTRRELLFAAPLVASAGCVQLVEEPKPTSSRTATSTSAPTNTPTTTSTENDTRTDTPSRTSTQSSTETSTSTPTPDRQAETDVQFNQSIYTTSVGERKPVTLSLTRTEDGYVVFGNEDDVNIEVNFILSDVNNNGEVGFVIDTGSPHSRDAFLTAQQGTEITILESFLLSEDLGPLDPADYDMSASTGEEGEETDIATFVIS